MLDNNDEKLESDDLIIAVDENPNSKFEPGELISAVDVENE